uniref:Uncharacterized protein LOC102805556 n=1 Tax=Saccoglossus kowalevskii TaxID=10224 RepID=A0ABM0MQH3_SACKO
MSKCVLLSILFIIVSVNCSELRGGLKPLTAESTEKEKRALKVAVGWIDCKRIAVYTQSPRMFFFIPSSNRDLNITIIIENDKSVYVTDNYILNMGAVKSIHIYDKGFETCNTYKVKWISKEAITSKNARIRNGKPISDYVDKGEQTVKMPCKCKQSVIHMKNFQLQTFNGGKYTYPVQKNGPCMYTLLRSCRPDTQIHINASIISNQNGSGLISMVLCFPKPFAHEVILSPTEPAK